MTLLELYRKKVVPITRRWSESRVAAGPGISFLTAGMEPFDPHVALYRALFWTHAQRTFVKEKIIEDADWAGVIDELNGRLD